MRTRVIRGRPIDEQFVADAIALRKQGKKQEAIAVELGVAQGTISVLLRKYDLGGGLVHPPPRRREDRG